MAPNGQSYQNRPLDAQLKTMLMNRLGLIYSVNRYTVTSDSLKFKQTCRKGVPHDELAQIEGVKYD